MDPNNITTTRIALLRDAASEASDLVAAHVCRVALGEEDPVVTAAQWEERYGGGGFSRVEQDVIRACTSRDIARWMVAEWIATMAEWFAAAEAGTEVSDA